MRKGTPAQFLAELEDKIFDLKTIDSSEIIDDGEEIIVADEEVETDVEEKVEDADNSTSVEEKVEEKIGESADEDNDYNEIEVPDDYFDNLYSSVEEKLNDLVDTVAWNGDDDNIYMDVSFIDGHIITFTIPREDLVYDADTDVNYICTAVRGDDFDEEYAAEENMDDLKEEYDIPAYL